MDFTYDDEQVALRDTVRGLLANSYGEYERRRQVVRTDPGFDAALWSRMATMGLLGLAFDEVDGGGGAGPIELGIVARELGRVIAPEPYMSAVVVAGGLISSVGTVKQRARMLPPVAEGTSILTFAHAEPGRRWSDGAARVTATRDGVDWLLDGVKEGVPHGASADQVLVSAALPGGGTGLFLVEGTHLPAAQRPAHTTYDGGRAARVTFAGTVATPLGEDGADATAEIGAALNIARIIGSQQNLGALDSLLHRTIEYLQTRRQFGVTLSAFQALTFRAADMYVRYELAQSVTEWATMIVTEGDPDEIADAAARTGLQVGRAARLIGQEAIQLHGGIGMTAEYGVGAHAAHVMVLADLLGDAGHHAQRLVAWSEGRDPINPLDRMSSRSM